MPPSARTRAVGRHGAVALCAVVTALAAVAALSSDGATGPAVTEIPDLRPPQPPPAPATPPSAPDTDGAATEPDPGADADADTEAPEPRRAPRAVRWRRSVSVGLPFAGALRAGVQLPAFGATFETWDPVRKRRPNRGWRRWGTDRLVRAVLRVLRDFAARHPEAPPVLVGDLSRPRGGAFGPRHASHQNGLDADVYYPRRDGRLRAARRPDQVDRRYAQALVDGFVGERPQFVFVGPSLDLRGPPRVVQPLRNHDDHLHVRLRP